MKSERSAMTGKVAIVTGAGQGIGKAIAAQFVRAGAKVVIAKIDRQAGHKTEKQLARFGHATFVHCDAGSLPKTRFCYTLVLAAIPPLATH